MRLSNIVEIAIQFIIIGFIGLILFLGIYLLIQKVIRKKKIHFSTLIFQSIFFVYLVVVLGATLGGMRISYNEGSPVNLQLFSSYKEAWYTFSKIEWQNLILNILLFVPMGFLLPLIHQKCKKWYVTYTIGFLFSVCIEILQFITARGIVEADDIFNNTLGALIGYGIFILVDTVYKKYQQQEHSSIRYILFFQIPLFMTIIAFSTIFLIYQHQELGNMKISAIEHHDMSNVHIHHQEQFSQQKEKAYVYQTSLLDEKECYDIVQDLFQQHQTSINEEKTDVYSNTIVYYDQKDEYCVCIEKMGGSLWITRHTEVDDIDEDSYYLKGLKYEDVKKILETYHIILPEHAEFKELDDGSYNISVSLTQVEDNYIDGSLSCSIYQDGTMSDISASGLKQYKKYKEYDLISKQEAFEKLQEGLFNNYYGVTIPSDMYIYQVKLNYELDTKGFYQPVYEFWFHDGNENNNFIRIPAI